MKKYDVIIVGAGPAGIFSSLEFVKKDGLKILMIEKGKGIEERGCPVKNGKCIPCKPCSVTSGWGGAGSFSDGKLTLSTEVGGWLKEYIRESKLKELIGYIEGVYNEFGAPDRLIQPEVGKVNELRHRAVLANLELVPFKLKHLGTENCYLILKNLYAFLHNKIDILLNTKAKEIIVENGKVKGVVTSKGEFRAAYVIIAPGREGAMWLKNEAERLSLSIKNNAVDVGVRVEVPAEVMEPLTSVLYEAKLIYYSKSFKDKVRTFCMNPYGVVSSEAYEDVITVNGHSYANHKTNNTNFALLVSTAFTEPFKEPIAYGKYITRLANLLSDGIIIQKLGDLKMGRRSTRERIKCSAIKPTLEEAVPGDLSFILPYRHLSDILEMIEAIDKIVPGVDSKDTLLYGVEVKFYSSRLKLKNNLETEIDNLFTIGDGAGITRGLVQSSISGVIAARAVIKNLSKVSKV